MKKKILLLALVFVCAYSFASVDIEVPCDLSLGVTEVLPGNQFSYFFPYFAAGPVRASFVFDDFMASSKWQFSCGLSTFAYINENFLGATASCFYKVYEFSNGSYLDLANTVDLGCVMLFSKFFDTQTGLSSRKGRFYFGADYTLNLYYRTSTKSKFYVGGGVTFATFAPNEFVGIYAINLTSGFRIPTVHK